MTQRARLASLRQRVTLIRSIRHPDRWQIWDAKHPDRPVTHDFANFRDAQKRRTEYIFDLTQI